VISDQAGSAERRVRDMDEKGREGKKSLGVNSSLPLFVRGSETARLKRDGGRSLVFLSRSSSGNRFAK